jgi:hypothetical protein
VCRGKKPEIVWLYRQLGCISIMGHGLAIVVSPLNAIVTPLGKAVIHK